jgi:hypothetical protein
MPFYQFVVKVVVDDMFAHLSACDLGASVESEVKHNKSGFRVCDNKTWRNFVAALLEMRHLKKICLSGLTIFCNHHHHHHHNVRI